MKNQKSFDVSTLVRIFFYELRCKIFGRNEDKNTFEITKKKAARLIKYYD